MTNNLPHLLLLTPPPPYGGGEVLNEYLLHYFENDPSFVCVNIGHRNALKKNQGKPSIKNIMNAVRGFWLLFINIVKSRPGCIYLGLPKNSAAFARTAAFILLARCARARIVGELGGKTFYFLGKPGVARKAGLFFLKKVDLIRVLSTEAVTILDSFGLTKTTVVYNGTEVPKSLSRPKRDGKLRFLYAGALAEYKGTDVLIRAFIKLAKKYNDVTLHLLGMWHSDELHKGMEDLIDREDMRDRICLHGHMTGAEKWDVFGQCHVYVHPTRLDGQPLSVIEAMGCGMPVIATRVGGIPDIVEDGVNGILLDEARIDELTEKMAMFADNPQSLNEYRDRNIKTYNERHTVAQYCGNLKRQLTQL